jgi:site-specific recombinase XerD
MLSDYFRSLQTLDQLHNGPVGPFIERFAAELEASGFSRITIRAHIGVSGHLCHWTHARNIAISDLDDLIGARFTKHLPHCRCRPRQGKYINSAGAGERLFRAYLCRIGITAPAPHKKSETAEMAIINAFCDWMKQNRGVTNGTLHGYRPIIISLLESIGGDPSRIDSPALRAFVLDYAESHHLKNLGGITTALRSFLRYLIAEGRCATGLEAALPAVAAWRLSSLPRYLPASDVERVIAVCDPTTPSGLRNRAIILLLARLGLRGDDVVHLRISDIDWQKANICLSGKGRREVLLPLTQEVGDAIFAYITKGRPAVNSDYVFIRSIAPLRPFSHTGLVTKVVKRAMHRAGVVANFSGAHVLRHSAATQMLRQGISLQDISAILRHRSIETTVQYAKVDIDLLRLVAQPWPEVTLC